MDATTYLDQELYVEQGYAAGANFWVRHSAADSIGGFNEQLEYYGGDDEEFGWRLGAAGVRLVYAPEVRLTHPPRERLRDIARKAYRGRPLLRRPSSGRHGIGERQPPMFRQVRPYLPPKRVRRLSRVVGLDYEPTLLELAQMHVARYLYVQLPTIVGDFVGERRLERPYGGMSHEQGLIAQRRAELLANPRPLHRPGTEPSCCSTSPRTPTWVTTRSSSGSSPR